MCVYYRNNVYSRSQENNKIITSSVFTGKLMSHYIYALFLLIDTICQKYGWNLFPLRPVLILLKVNMNIAITTYCRQHHQVNTPSVNDLSCACFGKMFEGKSSKQASKPTKYYLYSKYTLQQTDAQSSHL